MDGNIPTISANDLYTRLGTASAPALVDVRRRDHSGFDDRLIVGAVHHDAEHTQQWFNSLPADRPVVVYCSDGCDVSRGATRALRNAGIEAVRLAEGIAGWRNRRLPTRQELNEPTDKWVTRARPKIDRIACPWLIRRFIDPRADFLYVPPAKFFRWLLKRVRFHST
jgi:rhodanese-related sulfurtransferase